MESTPTAEAPPPEDPPRPKGSEPAAPASGRRRWIALGLGGAALLGVLVWAAISSRGYDFYNVPTASMEPTIPLGGRIVVEPTATPDSLAALAAGDIILFPTPGRTPDAVGARAAERRLELSLARIVAVGGDRVGIAEKTVTVNDTALEEPYAIWVELPEGEPKPSASPTEEIVVPEGYVFVLGDHRNLAVDSRVFGPIPRSTIIGRIVSTY